jgi:hypothetical protein
MRLLLALALLSATVSIVLAADVNGKWMAQVPGRNNQVMEVTLTLKADGEALTGAMSSARGELPIADGKISGDEISFTQTMQFGENKVKLLYKGKVSGDEIRFTRQREGGEGRAQEFTAKRAS